MSNRVYNNQPLSSLEQLNRSQKQGPAKQRGKPFAQILQQKLEKQGELKFSGHAKKRLNSREINMTTQDLNKLKEGVDKAEDKGAKESLILVNSVAYVVSVENKTVITAVDDQSLKENVFTNIDSAVVMD